MALIKRMMKEKYVVAGIFLILFFIPFFWFHHGEADFGGDASRLYFYDPWNFLKHLDFIGNSKSIAPSTYPSVEFIPFLVLLVALKWILFNSATLLLSVFNGMLLSGAFLSVYLVIREIIDREESTTKIASIAGGLFFIFSGIISYNWQRYLTSFQSIAVYPFVVWLFLKYIKTGKSLYVFAIALTAFIFSFSFSFPAAPVFFSFFPLVSIFLFCYAWQERQVKRFFKGLVISGFLLLLVQAFHIAPQIINSFDRTSATHQLIFSAAGKIDRGLHYFQGNTANVMLLYNMLGFPQYSVYKEAGVTTGIVADIYQYGVKYIGVFFIFPVIVCLAFLVLKKRPAEKSRLAFFSLFFLFLVILFLATANMFGSWGIVFYTQLFRIPGFSMFRSFYGAFAMVLAFIYAVLFGLSFREVIAALRHRGIRVCLVTLVLAALCYEGIPLISGKVANMELADSHHIKQSLKVKPTYEQMLSLVRNNEREASLVLAPLANFDYQVLEGEYGGAYVGIPALPMLTGKTSYGGLAAFDYQASSTFSYAFFLDRLQQHDYRTLNRLFSLLNIGYIFNNADPYGYENFSGFPYLHTIKDLFPTVQDFQVLIDKLGYQEVYHVDNYALYHNQETFLPRVYVPRTILSVETPEAFKEIIMKQEDYTLGTVASIKGSGYDQILHEVPTIVQDPPSLEFTKIKNTKYVVRAHGVRSSFPLVFSTTFHKGWKLYGRMPTSSDCSGITSASGSGIASEVAGSDEARAWCGQGVITRTGAQFISKRTLGVVQNKNLPSGNFWASWFLWPLEERYHTKVNDYANSWWIDLEYVQRQFGSTLIQNQDGTYDMEFILEFAPQRYFYIGLGISLLSVMGILGYLIVFGLRCRRKIQRMA